MSSMNQAVRKFPESNRSAEYQHLTLHQDAKNAIVWCYMHAAPRPCFTPELLEELNRWASHLRCQAPEKKLRYHVTASLTPGVFNLGGDLDVFRKLIFAGDAERLYAYARRCIDVLYANMTGFDSDVTTISLIQGEALGGGFEAALSSEVLIAERHSRFGFPEILFNLFPGMGAFSLLSRRIGTSLAQRLILSGKVYEAEELHAMGVVDVIADDGEGELAVYDYIKRENRARNGFTALRQARDSINPITYEELDKIVRIWVDAALRLEARDLKMMDRLVARQARGSRETEKVA
ncbi:enoyl-CoA hydratase [Halochromatium glycolicum]|uniref:Enoyl-CoA hydratase n=2 Tax=Halochromatium glycolicum TaxID=85075 RepID=A0AAJ0U5R5_9GAMM|nr:enoyl-CoA hydratase [Halochromatium glycolicum]